MAEGPDTRSQHPEDPLIDSAWLQEGAATATVVRPVTAGLPEKVAGYQVLGRLGAGGMGMVLEAVQHEPRRHVALKLLRNDQLPTDYHVHAFRREVRTLGRLRHPSIAAIYDAGQAEDGRPFFAMELIRGDSITEYASRNALSLHQKLELIQKVCDAVSHAHRRGIIHRDLKPSNILVDSDGLPKVLDFGLAKTLEMDPDVTTMATEPGRLVGTLPYMSPEQLRGRTEEIDTRTDVYALGVVLFELLSDRLPYSVSWTDLSGAVQAICDQPPSRLDLGRHAWAPDLQVIVDTALAKDASNRYQSVEHLSEDIRRVLAREPILARPPSLSYRFRKFVMRNRVACAFGAFAIIAVIAGLVTSTSLYVQADRERARAVAEAERADTVNHFLIEDMLMAASAAYKPGEEITVRSVFDTASQKVETAFQDHPLLEASTRQVLANVYFTLNDYEKAEEHLRRARSIFERELGTANSETIGVLADLARARHGQGAYADAEQFAREALTLYQALPDAKPTGMVHVTKVLGNALARRGKFNEAEQHLHSAYDLAVTTLGERDPMALDAMNDLAVFYWYQRRFPEAIGQFRRLVELRREVDGPEHPATGAALNNLGLSLWSHGELAEAKRVLAASLTLRQNVIPEGHPDTLGTMNNLALVSLQLGEIAQAERLFRDVYEGYRIELGEHHRNAVNALQNLATTVVAAGDVEGARPLYTRLIDLRRTAASSSEASSIDYGNYVQVLLMSEPADLRDPVTALNVVDQRFPPVDQQSPWLLNLAALADYQNGHMREAEELAEQAFLRVKPEDVFSRCQALITKAAAQMRADSMSFDVVLSQIDADLPRPREAALKPIINSLVSMSLGLFHDERFTLASDVLRDISRVVSADARELSLLTTRIMLTYVSGLLRDEEGGTASSYLDQLQPLLDASPPTSEWLRGYAQALRGVTSLQAGDSAGNQAVAAGIEVMHAAEDTPAEELRRVLTLAIDTLDPAVHEKLRVRLIEQLASLESSQ